MWFILSIAAALAYTAVNLLMRLLAIKSNSPRTFSFVYNFWGALFALIIFLLERSTPPDIRLIPWFQFIFIGITAILYGLFERFQFIARKGIDASTLVIIFRLTPVIAFAGSLIFFKEAIEPYKLLGSILLISSSLVVIHKNPQLRANPALLIALFCALTLGFAWMLDKPASVGIPASFYSAIMWALPLVFIAFPSIPIKQIVKEFSLGGWKVALTAFLNVLGFVFYLKAFALVDASQVIPIVSSSATLVVLGGILLLHERTFLVRKIISGVLMLIGIFLLR